MLITRLLLQDYDHRPLIEAPVSSAPWTPLRLTNLAGWWDSELSPHWQDSARTTPASINDAVGAWDDLSANARHVTTGVPTQRFQRQANIFGTKPGNLCSADDVLSLLSGLWADNGGSWWIVLRPGTPDASTYRRIVSARTGTDFDYNTNRALAVTAGPSSDQNIGFASFIGAANPMTGAIAYSAATNYLMQEHYSGGSATMKMAGSTASDTYTVSDAMLPNWFTMGAQRIAMPAFQEFFTGHYGCVIHTTTVASANEQALMAAYLLSRFGVSP